MCISKSFGSNVVNFIILFAIKIGGLKSSNKKYIQDEEYVISPVEVVKSKSYFWLAVLKFVDV